MADVTLEQLAQQLSEQRTALNKIKKERDEMRREVRVLNKANDSLKQKASLTHRPLAMWHNPGKEGKPDYFRVVMTDIGFKIILSLIKQGDFPASFLEEAERHLADSQQQLIPLPPGKLSFTLFPNDYKREGIESDPDYHGRAFDPDKSKQS